MQLPYGSTPGTGEQRSPCINCPTFEWRVKHSRPNRGGYAILPEDCDKCQDRILYADSQDPSRCRFKPTEERQKELDTPEYLREGGQSPQQCYMRGQHNALLLGYKTYEEAIVDLYFNKKKSTPETGKLLGLSQSKIAKDLKDLGYKTRVNMGGRKKRDKDGSI
jgi:hypothetical protein